MIDELHHVEPAQGFSHVLVPGEIEQRNEDANREKGITIASTVYEYLAT
jgi:ureidoglycolate dehydrogenase (NAD+)